MSVETSAPRAGAPAGVARVERQKLWLLAATCLVLAVATAVVMNSQELVRYRADIFQRWYATEQLFRAGRDLYDSRNGADILAYPGVTRYQGELTNFFYPAHLLLFTGPLALLPYRAAHLVWTAVAQLFYLAGLIIFARESRWPRSVNALTGFVLLAFLFIPAVQHTIWAQFNTIGLLALALSYRALRRGAGRGDLAWAGVWAAGLTFKPHTAVLALVFLGLWALARRERWFFFAGLLPAGLGLWLLAELMQPGWVVAFLGSLGGYTPVLSVVDRVGNPYQLTAAALLLGALVLFLARRDAAAGSDAFAGGLVVSIAAWFLVVPLEGMMHIVLLPAALSLLLGALRDRRPRLYAAALAVAALLYVAGLAGFTYGLADAGRYGRHLHLAETLYRDLAPLLVTLLGVYVAWCGTRQARPTSH